MSADFSQIKADLVALESAVSSGSVSGILRATAAVEVDAADVIDAFTGDPVQVKAKAKADPTAAECVACCDRIKAACHKSHAGAVPGWLSKLIALVPTLIDLFKDIFGG